LNCGVITTLKGIFLKNKNGRHKLHCRTCHHVLCHSSTRTCNRLSVFINWTNHSIHPYSIQCSFAPSPKQ